MQSLISGKPRAMEVENVCIETRETFVSPRNSGQRELHPNKVQPHHARCQVSNLCLAQTTRSAVSCAALHQCCLPAGRALLLPTHRQHSPLSQPREHTLCLGNAQRAKGSWPPQPRARWHWHRMLVEGLPLRGIERTGTAPALAFRAVT